MEKSSAVLHIKNIDDVYGRLFNHHPVVGGEINYFLKEFEENRKEREVEKLFEALEKTTEIKDSLLDKARHIAETYLSDLSVDFESALNKCNTILQKRSDRAEQEEKTLPEDSQAMANAWDAFIKDINEKRANVDESFNERQLQLEKYYKDLEEGMLSSRSPPS